VKISDNASFSLQLFVFVHVPAIFSVLLTYSLKINSYYFLNHPVYSTHLRERHSYSFKAVGLYVVQRSAVPITAFISRYTVCTALKNMILNWRHHARHRVSRGCVD